MGDRPNILLIMTDQHRWDALSAVSDWLSTPHLDRIAAEGMRANRAYTNSPVCVPARVSLATGRYPHNTGVWENSRYDLPGDAPTWMRSVQEAGYSTSVFGKTHLHGQVGDLRDRIDLVRSWGLDHVDEIAGPRASTKTSSNLTDLWDRHGVREAYVRDVQGRVRERALGGAPLAAPARPLPRRVRRPAGGAMARGPVRPAAMDVLGELQRAARALGLPRAVCEQVRPGRHAGADRRPRETPARTGTRACSTR